MTKKLIAVTPLPARKKPFSEMTEEELAQYASDLVDGGLFSGVPGMSSEASATPEQSED
ncbi:MAG: hypothetical protein ACLP5O_18455 [Acidimicrobiales bacterium]